jgi:hypothetical protein
LEEQDLRREAQTAPRATPDACHRARL